MKFAMNSIATNAQITGDRADYVVSSIEINGAILRFDVSFLGNHLGRFAVAPSSKFDTEEIAARFAVWHKKGIYAVNGQLVRMAEVQV